MRWMTWSFGQVTVFTNLAISASGAGTRDGRAAAARQSRGFLAAMERATHLVLRRSDDAIRLVYQQVLRPLPAKEAVDRGEPVSEAPLVLPSAKHAQHSRQAPGRPIVGRGIQSVAGKVVHAAMAHREDLPVLLPLVRLGTGVAGAEPRHPGDLCRGQPIAALKYGFTRFGRHARLDQLVLGRRDLRDESLDDRTERLILATLNDAPDERREIGHSIC